MSNIILNGKEYSTIKEAVKDYNLIYNTVLTRLNKGWSLEEAFELKEKIKNGGKGKPVVLEEKQYISISHAVREYKLNYDTVMSRIHTGWSLEEAFEIVPRKNKIKKDDINYRFDIFNYKDFDK